MTTEADITRYVKITHAHQVLTAIGADAALLAALADSCPFDDGADLNRPLRDALAIHRDRAGRAATGQSAPYDPTTVDYDYTAAIATALDTIALTAAAMASRARAVRDALDAGLITDPRQWSAADINEGRMLEALEPAGDAEGEHAWYAFDALFLEGCLHALERFRSDEAVDADVYARHMARIAAVAPVIGPVPAGTAERVAEALAHWHDGETEAAHALDAPTATLPARHALFAATTYARLEAFATALTGPAWDGERRAAHQHMRTLSQRAYAMGTDGHGKTRADAAALFERLHAWRYDTYTECIAVARGFADLEPDADGWADAEERAYHALYLAADIATNTHQLLDVWNGAGHLDTDHRFNIRVGVLLNFEASRTGTGAPLADTGPGLGDATRALREKVDAYPVSKNSNLKHTVTYRRLKETLEAIDAAAPMADTGLIRAWAHIVTEADAAVITRRQTGELRRLVNAKVAELCDGDEGYARRLHARLTDWDRITDELAA